MSTAPSPQDHAAQPGAARDDAPPQRYAAPLANQIEARWQDRWEAERTFAAPNPGEPGFDPSRPKRFILDMFPYPSGVGLHVGHPLGFIATDIYARFLRMTGHNVLHAMGYDSFGLPAEQFAVQTNTHPRITTEKNIATMRRQMRRLGLAHDPRRSVSTTDTEFYKWTQWIFLQIYNAWYDKEGTEAQGHGGTKGKARHIRELVAEFESGKRQTSKGKPWAKMTADERRAEIDQHRLAFLSEVPVNWCPGLGTVLANEEVIDGRSERGNFPVYRRPLKQWMMRITEYADRLLDDLEPLAWPEPIKLMQRNWIGRSEGAYVDFDCAKRRIRVFTTRPDTLFGATYMVLSPEHPMVDEIVPNKPCGTAFQAVQGSGSPNGGTAGTDAHSLKGCATGFKHAVFPGAEDLLARNAPFGELVAAYRAYARDKSDVARQEGKEKTGVFTGAFALNPVNGQRIPVYLADYVLMGYGTGAIMAVPAHDERDFEFAQAFNLPIRDVVYERPAAAMAYFALKAYPNGTSPGDAWKDQLADFIAASTSAPLDVDPLDVVFDVIRSRRATAAAPGEPSQRASATAPGSIGKQRGAVKQIWLDTITELKIESFEQLRAVFAEAGYYRFRGAAFGAPGIAANSHASGFSIDGLPTSAAKAQLSEWLEKQRFGKKTTTYKLRDWLFSRQRYWGEPFPIVFDAAGNAHDLPEAALPVLLPHVDNFKPASSDDPNAPVVTPLGRATEWVTTRLDLGRGDGEQTYTRETNTMPNWAGSCWYYLRYLDPANNDAFVGKNTEQYWMLSKKSDGSPHIGGVDLYVGGVEHAVLHLLYARFWHKVLFDLGHVSTPEPFGRLFNQGYIQAAAYTDARGAYVEAAEVEERASEQEVEVERPSQTTGQVERVKRKTKFFYKGQPVFYEYGKMGKALKNAVSPDEVCAAYGCDTMRVYEMSMGPLEASKPWNTRDIAGAYRFLQRVWRNIIDEQSGTPRVTDAAADAALTRVLHKTILGVTHDYTSLGFNTAVAKLIEFNNELTRLHGPETKQPVPRAVAEALTLMLAPMAPHMAEELWSRLGHTTSLAHHAFPVADPKLAADDQIEIPVQVLGKLRGKIVVPAGSDAKAIEAAALADETIRKHIEGKPIKKVIVVPGKLVNLVVG